MAHARDIYMFLRAEQTSMHAGYPRLAMQKGSDLVAHDLPTLGLSEISGKPTASRWTSCVFECVLAHPVPPFLHIPIAAIADLHKLVLILRCGSTRATFWPTLTCRGTGEGHRLDALKPTEQGFNLLNRSFSITFGVVNVVGLRRIFYIDTFGAAFRGILCHFESWLVLQLKHSWSVPL